VTVRGGFHGFILCCVVLWSGAETETLCRMVVAYEQFGASPFFAVDHQEAMFLQSHIAFLHPDQDLDEEEERGDSRLAQYSLVDSCVVAPVKQWLLDK
jgi:hypothetical protein